MSKQIILSNLFFCFFILPFLTQSQTPSLSWVNQIGDVGPDAGNSVKIDRDGNIVLVGFFRGSSDFDPGPSQKILKSNGSEDIFVSKYNQNGELIWARNFGGRFEDRANQVAIDSFGSILVTGYFRGQVIFDSTDVNANFNSKGFSDGFILKLDQNGQLVFVKQLGGNLDDIPKSITLDNHSNILVAGYFQGKCDFDPSLDTSELSSKGVNDVFVLKLNHVGQIVWVKHIGGRFDDQVSSVLVNPENEIVLSGNFLDTIDLDPGVGNYKIQSKGSGDVFVLFLSEDGEFIKAGQFASDKVVNHIGASMDVQGNIYLTGYYDARTDFDPGADSFYIEAQSPVGEIFVVKLNKDGQLDWAKNLGGDAHDVGLGITSDALGNIYATGCFQGLADFDPNAGEFIMEAKGLHNNDVFICKLNASGEFVWARSINGPMNDIGFSLVCNQENQLFVTGIFSANVIVNVNPDTIALQSRGAEDAFLIGINQMVSHSDEGNKEDLIWSIYPNPTGNNIIVEVADLEFQNSEFTLFDHLGKVVYTLKNFKLGKEQENCIPMEDLPSGHYLLHIKLKHTTYIKAVVKL